MSVQAISWALTVTGIPPTAKLVLLSLANYADDRAQCWPSLGLVAEEALVSQRSVRRHIRTLEEAGFVETVTRWRTNGSQSSNAYRLLISDTSVREGGQIVRGGRTSEPPLGGTSEPPLDPSIEPSIEEDTYVKPNGSTPVPNCPYEEIRQLWNSILGKRITAAETWTDARKQRVRRLWKNGVGADLEDWESYFRDIAASKFLRGEVKSWKADFDWALNPENVTKVVEGNYE